MKNICVKETGSAHGNSPRPSRCTSTWQASRACACRRAMGSRLASAVMEGILHDRTGVAGVPPGTCRAKAPHIAIGAPHEQRHLIALCHGAPTAGAGFLDIVESIAREHAIRRQDLARQGRWL